MDENIGTMLAQVSRLLRRSFDVRARGIGVTRPQWQVLSLLSFNGGINQGGLAELLEVEPITLGRMIDRLQDAQMVERRPDPTDRRVRYIFVTPAGEQAVADAHTVVDGIYEDVLKVLPAEEREVFLGALVKLVGSRLSTPVHCDRPVRRRSPKA